MLAAILESSFPVSHSFNATLTGAGTVNTGISVAPRGCSIVPIKENVFPTTSLCPANPRPGKGGGGDLHWLVHYPNINWAFHAFSTALRDFSVFPEANSVSPRQLIFSIWSSPVVCFLLFSISRNFSTTLIILKLLSLFRGCDVSSEEVFKKTTITERTKTYEALILKSELFSGQV